MNSPQIFDFKGFNVRATEHGGAPWFVLKDVCGVLGLAHRVVRQRLSEDVCSTYPLQLESRTQGDVESITTLITGKGQVRLAERLIDEFVSRDGSGNESQLERIK